MIAGPCCPQLRTEQERSRSVCGYSVVGRMNRDGTEPAVTTPTQNDSATAAALATVVAESPPMSGLAEAHRFRQSTNAGCGDHAGTLCRIGRHLDHLRESTVDIGLHGAQREILLLGVAEAELHGLHRQEIGAGRTQRATT